MQLRSDIISQRKCCDYRGIELPPKLFVIGSPDQLEKRCEALHLLKEILVCSETDYVDVDEYLSTDCEGDQHLSDQEIVFLMTQDLYEESDTINEVYDVERRIHMLKKQKPWKQYSSVQQHWNATATDVMFMRCWFKISS